MDSDKIIQTATKLMEITSTEQIHWERLDANDTSYPLVKNGTLEELLIKSRVDPKLSDTLFPGTRQLAGIGQFRIYAAPVENEIFCLVGLVSHSQKIIFVKLQIWNKEARRIEYEFPQHAILPSLFHIVDRAELYDINGFLKRFLQKSDQVELAS